MELRHLRYFLEITKDLNMTKASKRLGISQPPLSRQIKQLEEELGVNLFDRTGNNLTLTDAGTFFTMKAQQILDSVDSTSQAVARIGGPSKKWLNIGFVPSTIYGFLPQLIRRYRTSSPNVEVALLDLMSQDQIHSLKSGQIDIGFGRLKINDPEIKREVIFEEPLMAVFQKGHPLANRKSISLEEMSQESLILYPKKPRPNYADQISALFYKHSLQINVVQEVQELQTTLGLIASGVGSSIVPRSVQKMRTDDVVYVPFKNPDAVSPVVMSYLNKIEQTEELRKFIKRVRLLAHLSSN